LRQTSSFSTTLCNILLFFIFSFCDFKLAIHATVISLAALQSALFVLTNRAVTLDIESRHHILSQQRSQQSHGQLSARVAIPPASKAHERLDSAGAQE
jgi:K+ transporter